MITQTFAAPWRTFLLAALVALPLGLQAAAQGMPGGPARVAEVGFITAKVEAVPSSSTLPGRAVAFEEANIRPTVMGIVEAINYKPGQALKAGDLMFTLQRQRYLAADAAAQAEKAGADAAVASARNMVERYRKLVGSGVTQVDLDTAETNLLAAQATLSAAESRALLARMDLDGTEIRSPIDGIPAVSTVSVGAVVTANQTDALTTVRRLDPIYVDMSESSARMLRVRQQITSGELSQGARVAIGLTLEDGTQYDGQGEFVSPDTQVSTTTGTVNLRIQFDNPDRLILPGQFLRVNVEVGTSEAILVPQRATSRGSDGSLNAFVVKDGKAAQVSLTETGSYQNSWIVTEGIAAGDQIIVDGLKSLRDGAEIKAVEVAIGEDGLIQTLAPPNSAAPNPTAPEGANPADAAEAKPATAATAP